jgi:hypothetical protein
MSMTLDHITRSIDGIATIRDVSPTHGRGTLNQLWISSCPEPP